MDGARLTDPELLAYSGEHVAYEIQMFLCSYRFVFTAIDWDLPAPASLPEHLRKWTVQMALLEALMGHARVLINFLYPRSIEADDITAAHFFDDPEQWEKIRPGLSEPLDAIRRRANKELAHLTTRRIAGTPAEKGHRAKDFAELWETVKLFMTHASPSRLHQNVRDLGQVSV
jgi:hypothetical protein